MAGGFQTEIVLSPGGDTGLPDAADALVQELSSVWNLPLCRKVRVQLTGTGFDTAEGRLEIDALPEPPFAPHRPLRLRIGNLRFSHRQILSWTLV